MRRFIVDHAAGWLGGALVSVSRPATLTAPGLPYQGTGAESPPIARHSQDAIAVSRNYRPDIDGLRAIAVLSVLFYHCGVVGITGGFVGVDVFFVISGFLITGHIASDIAAGRMSILQFYERRARRILPALLAMLVVTWVAAAFVLLPAYFLQTSKALIAAATSVSNVYLWKSADYFSFESSFQPLLHTWSLSVEEQFYLFIPILMIVTAKPLRGQWPWLFAPLCVGSFALSVYATNSASTANFYLLPPRAWELGLGALIATTPFPLIEKRLTAELTGAAALVLILAPVFLFTDATPFPGLNALYPCLGAALLIHVGRSTRSAATSLLSTPPLVGIGLISYSLYLVHWPIISLLRFQSVGVLDGWRICEVIAASLLLAILSWRFVERPFRRATPALTRGRVFSGALAGLALACVLGIWGVVADGFPLRFPNFAEQKIPGRSLWKPDRCFLVGDLDHRRWSASECVRIATGPRRVLLWGDSFAAQYMPGLLSHADELKATVVQYTAAGCIPILYSKRYGLRGCRDFSDHVLDVIRDQKIDTVLMSGRWTRLQQAGLAELVDTLRILDGKGIDVVLFGQSPEFATDVQVIGYLKGSRAPDAVNSWPIAFPLKLNDEIAAVAGRHAFINPLPVLCTGALCPYQDHKAYLFADYGHLSQEGSERVVEALCRKGRPLCSPNGVP